MADAARPTPQAVHLPARRTWSLPVLRELPKLTELTLASAIGGTGGTGGGGSTVFGLLLAVGLLLSGCSADDAMGPGTAAIAPTLASISCTGDITTKVISCATPAGAPGQAIVGGQGKRVVLQSSDVLYTDAGGGDGDLTFKVQVRNVSTQHLGYGFSGIRVFFEAAPAGVPGTITVEDDSIGTFTAGGQHYYKYPGELAQWDITPPLQWRFHMTGNVTTFTFNVLVAATVADLGGVLRWESVQGLDQRNFNDVAANATNDRMAVGAAGITAHFDGITWTTIPGIVGEGITSVVAVGAGEYYAATEAGAILHFNGNAWTETYRRGDYGGLNAIYVLDAGTIVAVGQQGRISRLAGGTWSDDDVATALSGDFIAVDGNSDGSRISAVTNAQGALEVWTSTSGGPFAVDPAFALIGSPVDNLAGDLVYDADGNVLVAYRDFTLGMRGKVRSSTGASIMNNVDVFATALVPLGSGQVAIATYSYPAGGAFLSRWDYQVVPNPLSFSQLLPAVIKGMALTDAGSNTFTVTDESGKDLFDLTGSTWTALPNGANMVNPDLWGIGDSVWLADGSDGFYKIVNGVATSLPGYPGLATIWGTSSTSFVASTNDGLVSGDGSGGWFTLLYNPSLRFTDLWAGPGGSIVGLYSTTGMLFRYRGGGIGSYFLGEQGSAVWGCDDDNAWFTTESGNIYHWENGTLDPTPQVTAPVPLWAITGTSCTDIWAVGDAGAAYHFDGTSWSDKSDPFASYSYSITPRGPGQVLVAGDAGMGGLFSTGGGFLDGKIPTQGFDVKSLWRLDNGQVYAAGFGLFLRGLR